MSKKPSFRDLEKLSAYLDGELNASAHQRMKNRLARDPELAAALDDLRQSRAVLRRTPKRRAPRNFTLSPKLVAKRPPMPRLVPALNYASLAAILLFVFSFLSPFGLGGSAAPAQEMMAAEPMAMEPAAAAEPAMEMAAEPAADALEEESRSAEAEMPAAEDMNVPGVNSASGADEEAGKVYAEATLPAAETRAMSEPQQEPLLSRYQRTLLILLMLFVLLAWVVRRATVAKWQKLT